MEFIIRENVLTFALLFMAVAGIAVKISVWVAYKRLESATNNMNESKNPFTRRIKMKFENCYKLNLDIKNISAFVEKYVRSYKQMGIPISYFRKILQIVAVLVGIVALGGSFLQYAAGYDINVVTKTIVVGIMGELIILLSELVFDTNSIPDRIVTNLEEYLENVFSKRLQLEYDDSVLKPVISEEEQYQLGDIHTAASKVKLKRSRSSKPEANEEETVIREIIKEFLC